MKPKEARREAGRAEKPGGRRPDWPGLSRRLLLVLSPDLFCSPGIDREQKAVVVVVVVVVSKEWCGANIEAMQH